MTTAYVNIEVVEMPGEPARVVLKGAGEAEAACEVDPASAVALAADLLEVARNRLGRARERTWGGGPKHVGPIACRAVDALEANDD
ncbi:MAG: hypothetical protein FJX60_22825 [Alphaproteobacteria bacterium]|nr:hypothetical protein [Alphaproteobacteria bacterium]